MEDVGPGDLTSRLVVERGTAAEGRLIAKGRGVVAGLAVLAEAGRMFRGLRVELLVRDGARVRPGQRVARLRGDAGLLLQVERTLLNMLQRLSGTATLTAAYVRAAGPRVEVWDTRKTTPLWRPLEKEAVRAGGGHNHRASLGAAILIKDNHLRLAGGVRAAVTRARSARRGRVQVEVTTLRETQEAVEAGARALLLDNMPLPRLRKVVAWVRRRAPGTWLEVSGGITLTRARALARERIDAVSVGALTHSAPALDLSLEIYPL